MTKAELEERIQTLSEMTEGLGGLDKILKQNDINALKMVLEGMALGEITNKLDQITLPNQEEMDSHIQAAKSAIEARNNGVAMFDVAFGALKTAIGIVL